MQDLHLFFDFSAVAAVLGAGVVIVRTNGRLRSAEAKRNALQSRVQEMEQQRAQGMATVDDTAALVQATTEKLLLTANRRVTDMEKALQSAEKQQALGIQRVADLEKSLALQKRLTLEPPKVVAPPAAAAVTPPLAPLVETVGTTDAPPVPVRAATSAARKALITVLLGASREAKSPDEIEKHLTGAGYRVVRATSTKNILTTAQDSRPDLVVLDTQISGGDSLGTLEDFKADPDLRDLPVVVICALKDRDRAIEIGAAGCVVPPITSNVLLGTVKTAFISHRKRMERSRLAKTANNSGNSGSGGAVLTAAE